LPLREKNKSSYISNSKMKRFLKHIVYGLLIFASINLIIVAIYEYPVYKAIKNKTHRNYLKWNDIHQNKNTYDLVIIGSSRAYTAFNPVIIDSALNIKAYNMGTSSQDIVESYYTLKEILDYQKPKYIVFDVFFPCSDDMLDYYQIFSNSSFFESSKRKLELVTKGYGSSGILNYTVPLVKYRNYIKQDIGGLFSDNRTPRKEDHWIRGYLNDSSVVEKEKIEQFDPISNYQNVNFNASRFQIYLKKIKTLAEDHNAKLICVRSPYPPSRMALSQTDDEKQYFEEHIDPATALFFDLNSFKTDSTYIYKDQDFADYHHPNISGAKKASSQLVEIIKQELQE